MTRLISAISFAVAMVLAIGVSHAQGPTPDNPYSPSDLQFRSILFHGSWEDLGILNVENGLGGDVLGGLAATGTDQATAYNLSSSPQAFTVVFSTVNAGTGVALSADLDVGQIQIILNTGANALKEYPPVGSGGTIDGASSATIAATTGFAMVQRIGDTAWKTISGGSGGGGGSSIPATTSILCGSGSSGVSVACPSLHGISSTGQVAYGAAANTAIQGNTVVVPGGAGCVLGEGATFNGAVCASLSGLAYSGNVLSVIYGTTSGTSLQGSLRAAANGVAALDSGGLIPAGELPVIIQNTLGSGGVLCENGTTNAALNCTPTGLTTGAGGLAVVYGHSANQALQGTERGAASGVAPLDGSALVPFANLPVITHSCGWKWSSNDTLATGTFPLCSPSQAHGAVLQSVTFYMGGTTPAGTVVIQVAGSPVAGCGTINLNSSTSATNSCGAAAVAQNAKITAVISAVSGTGNTGLIQANYTTDVE